MFDGEMNQGRSFKKALVRYLLRSGLLAFVAFRPWRL